MALTKCNLTSWFIIKKFSLANAYEINMVQLIDYSLYYRVFRYFNSLSSQLEWKTFFISKKRIIY
jgi:hypothetical protein